MALKCASCRTDNPDDSRFCRECAAPLKPSKRSDVSRTKSLRARYSLEGRVVAGKYRILREIGRGGMGIVYEARDLRLERPVALKFLAPELTLDKEAKERFIQEARAASALDHPNICTVYDIDEDSDHRMFIAMGFIDGGSLREWIERGRLEVEKAVDITRQAAEGLARAHAKGIVHRDIKPANIMLGPEGTAKIVDFGLAKLAGQVKLTRTGTTLGTLAYMSPEQARGEAADHRSDIWSLGVVLYEMLSGELPFHGEHIQGMIYSILNKAPIPLSTLRPDIPEHVADTVAKALEKDPFRRHQMIEDLIRDLTPSSPLNFPKTEKSIVVLPFQNLSPDPGQEYFSDGLTEEIISDLSSVHSLSVISRSSAMTFKSTKKTVPEIAGQLNVQYVLEGSVRKSGNSLRITVQLIDAHKDVHMWAEKYSGTMDDIFEIQEKVSRSIVEALKLKLSPEERHKLAERPIDNVAAYEYYLKAKAEIFQYTEDSIRAALRYLQNAVDVVGENALLYSGIALAYWQLANAGMQEDALARAEEYVEKALAINPSLSKAHAVHGRIFMYQGNIRLAAHHLRRAIALDSDDTFALQSLAMMFQLFLGRTTDSVVLVERLQRIDPLDVETAWLQGGLLFFAGDYHRSLPKFKEFYRIWPENLLADLWYAIALACCGQADEAFSVIDRMAKAFPGNAGMEYALFMKYALKGKREKAFEQMTPGFIRCHRNNGFSSYMVAALFALLNEKEKAFEWLEYGINRGFINYPLFKEPLPFMANIRGEERFQKLMDRVKYEWERFEA